MAEFYIVSVSHCRVTASQREQYQDLETEAAKWYSANVSFIIPVLFQLGLVIMSLVRRGLFGLL